MKRFILPAILLLFQHLTALGQQLARQDTTSAYTILEHPRHSLATRVGEGVMIGSGIILIGGYWAGSTNAGKQTIAEASVGGIIAGGIILFLGKSYERKHKSQFTITSHGNELGMAYNF